MTHGIHSRSCCQPGRQPFCHFRIEDGNIGEDIVIPKKQLPPLLMILDNSYISDLASCPGSRRNDDMRCLRSCENLKPHIILKFSPFFQKDGHSLCCIDSTSTPYANNAIGSQFFAELRPLIDNVDARVRFYICENSTAQIAKNLFYPFWDICIFGKLSIGNDEGLLAFEVLHFNSHIESSIFTKDYLGGAPKNEIEIGIIGHDFILLSSNKKKPCSALIYPVRNNAPLLPPGLRPSGPEAAAGLDFRIS